MMQTIASAKKTISGQGGLSNAEERNTSEIQVDAVQVMEAARLKDETEKKYVAKVEAAISEKVLRDTSPEAVMGRRKMALRAMYGEFMCTLLFYTPIFASCVNAALTCNSNPNITSLIVALVGGFQAIGVSFGFSSVSGAHFNSAISFALWLTGKLSNRKVVMYIFVQMLASIVGMLIVAAMFHGNPTCNISMEQAYEAVSVYPPDTNRLGKVFASEFFMTFFLTYIAFSVAFEDSESQKKNTMSLKTISDSKGLTLYASTPQSKTGFAPFSIGFMIFSLSLLGGSSGGAFNPGRILGPAIFSGKGKYIWLYWLGEFLGASAAAMLVGTMHSYGLSHSTKDTKSAAETVKEVIKISEAPSPTVTPLA